MNKFLKKIFIFVLLMSPSIVYAADYVVCGNNKKFPFAFATVIAIFLVIVRIVVPLLLVITGMISFIKVTISSKAEEEMDKTKKKLITNILTAVIIFFLIPIIRTVFSISFGSDNSFNSCLTCMSNPFNCEVAESTAARLCPGLMSDQSSYDDNCNYTGLKKELVDYRTGSNGVTAYTSAGSVGGSALYRSAGGYASWKQCDPRWGGNRLGPSTICDIGCYATSTSILIAMSGTTLLVDNFDPGVFVAHAGFSAGGGLNWGTWYSVAPNFKVASSEYFGKVSKSQKAAQIDAWQKQGYYVMIGVRSGGHWVAVDRVVGDTVYIFDPGHDAVDLFTDYAADGVTRAVLFKNEG